MATPKEIIRDIYYPRLFDGGELWVADEIIAPEFFNNRHPTWPRGPEGIKKVVRSLHKKYDWAFHALHTEILLQVAEGNVVFTLTRQTGKGDEDIHLAELQSHFHIFNDAQLIVEHRVVYMPLPQ